MNVSSLHAILAFLYFFSSYFMASEATKQNLRVKNDKRRMNAEVSSKYNHENEEEVRPSFPQQSNEDKNQIRFERVHQKAKHNIETEITETKEDQIDPRRFAKSYEYYRYYNNTNTTEYNTFYGNYYQGNDDDEEYYDFAGKKLFHDYEEEFVYSFNQKFVPGGYALTEGQIIVLIAIPIMICTFLCAYCCRSRPQKTKRPAVAYIDAYYAYD